MTRLAKLFFLLCIAIVLVEAGLSIRQGFRGWKRIQELRRDSIVHARMPHDHKLARRIPRP